jgi:hypothetical protein
LRRRKKPLQEREGTVYQRITPRIVETLREIVGTDDVFCGSQDAEELEPYAHDETVGLRAEPGVVVRVTSPKQVKETVTV